MDRKQIHRVSAVSAAAIFLSAVAASSVAPQPAHAQDHIVGAFGAVAVGLRYGGPVCHQ